MAFLFGDTFDHYSTAALAVEKWGNGSATGLLVGAYGRNGTQGLRIAAGGVSQTTGYVQSALANLATSIAGFALRGTGTDRPVVRWMDNTTEQCSLYLRSDGRLAAYGPGGLLAVGSAVISSSVHSHIEAKVTISDAGGVVQVKVNQPSGSSTYDINVSSVDTKATANAYATAFRLGYGLGSAETTSYVYEFDDAYIFSTSGSYNTDFVGDCKLECLIVNAAGGSTQFTPSAGANYQNVDDASPDDDTTYNASSTAGHLDRFNLPSLVTTAGTVHAHQVVGRIKKTDAGARTARLHSYLSTAGTPTQESADIFPTTAYTFERAVYERDGDTNAWSVTKINALEIGVEVQA